MSGRQDDRGLDAVRRVREVRERDSRIGLQQAINEQLDLQRRVALLENLLEAHRSSAAGQQLDLSTYAARESALQAQGAAVRQARAASDAARVVRESADAHWKGDKTRLSAVESLLEVRAEERRAEAGRAEAKVLDENGSQSWLRRSAREQRGA